MVHSTAPDKPAAVVFTERLESSTGLDSVVRLVRPLVHALLADPGRADLLQGKWLGHALHPPLTDVPIGAWTSATILDLVGGRKAQPAAKRLIGVGILAAAPTALTGWAEWGAAEQREQRVGVVHAGANIAALTLYTASWRARGKGRHLSGVALGLGGSLAVTIGGYLGGHLVAARKVASRHPAFADDDSLAGAPFIP
jgi:uncharacterized membrane protein